MRVITAVTGASGAILGIRLLEALRELDISSELILSPWAERTIRIETDYKVEAVRALADVTHRYDNLAASISSGSHPVDAMVVCPCSMNTLSAIAHGLADNLITRAADVTLKERRPLVVVPRETPLSLIHLRNMTALCEAGGRIMPPMPAFYNRPTSVDEVVSHIVARVLDQLGIPNELTRRWGPASAMREKISASELLIHRQERNHCAEES